jgi:hypothetical protein
MRRYYSPGKMVEYALNDAQTAEDLKLFEPFIKEGDENYDPNLPEINIENSKFYI